MPKINIDYFLTTLEKEVANYKVPVVDLINARTSNPFKVLVATILSARTKDEVTAKVSARLFKKIETPADLTVLGTEKIEKLIYPVNFYKNKARYLAALPSALEKYGGKIPDTVEELVQIPGVGRKTANLVVAVAFRKPAVCVDTHVHRIMNRWGYVNTKTPEQTEKELRKKLPKKYWLTFNSILVAFGQGTCRPVAPHCDRCPLNERCPKIGVKSRRLMGKAAKRKNKDGLRMVSWNVNGLRAVAGKGFMETLEVLDADILALQETRVQSGQLDEKLVNIPGYESYFNHAEKKGYSGVAVYTRISPLNTTHGMGDKESDGEGRIITLEFQDFFFVNAYFPNAGRELKRLDFKLEFNRRLQQYLLGLSSKKSVMVCGDFNVAHKPIDLANPQLNENNAGYTPEERTWMDDFLAAGFVDTFRMFNHEGGNYSWWSYRSNAREKNIGWRIDYFCVDKKSVKRVGSAAILKNIQGSDHCPVEVIFK